MLNWAVNHSAGLWEIPPASDAEYPEIIPLTRYSISSKVNKIAKSQWAFRLNCALLRNQDHD